MLLRLQFPPTPDRMADHAANAVTAAANVAGIDLNFTVASLDKVDRILGGLRADGVASEQVAETLFTFGAYIGEVMVRCADGAWVQLPAENPLSGWPVIQLGPQHYANPIGKAFKRVDLGDGENIGYFYRVMTDLG